MNFFRRQRTQRQFTCLLFLGLVLRALVAPGYMLDTATGELLTVTLCGGPAGIYRIDALSTLDDTPPARHHDEPGHHDHNNAAREHASASCGPGSAGSQLLDTRAALHGDPAIPPAGTCPASRLQFYPIPDCRTCSARDPPPPGWCITA